MSSRINYVLKKPDQTRKSFLVLKLSITNNKRVYEKVENEAIDAINKAFQKDKALSACIVLAKEVIANLYKELNKHNPKVVHNSANRDLLEKFWKDEYEHRDLIDFESSKNDFKRAIEAVGPLSLYSTTREDLQKEVAKSTKGNKQRRIVERLNTLLKYIGRDIKLRKDKKHHQDVAYLNETDVLKMLKHIESEDVRLMAEAAFYTGCRTGELFAISSTTIRTNTILVQSQIDREGNKRGTKNRLVRKAFIIAAGRTRVKQWAALDKSSFRNLKFADIINQACQRAFPEDQSKWIVFHDLRHSYAIYLLSKGISLSLVAQSLGNSVTVCQENYAGFSLADESIDSIEQILSKT